MAIVYDDPVIDLAVQSGEEVEITIDMEDFRAAAAAIEKLSHWMAIYAVNLSNMEGVVDDAHTEATAANATADNANATAASALETVETALTEIDDVLESTGLSRWSRLNRPNLLSQAYWTNVDMPTSTSVVHQAVFSVPAETAEEGETAATQFVAYAVSDRDVATAKVLSVVNSNYNSLPASNYSVEIININTSMGTYTVRLNLLAGRPAHSAVTITVRVADETENVKVPYGEDSRWYASGKAYYNSIGNPEYRGADTADGVQARVVDLAAADQITEPDGEVYDKAIQYNVTANTACGNADWMVFNYQNFSDVTYDASRTEPKDYGNIEEMVPGEKYTMSCWARMVSGDKAWVRFGYGGKYGNTPYSETTYSDICGIRSDLVEVAGTEWQRIHWTFTFDGPTGPQYTYADGTRVDETTGDTIATITRTKNWTKRVQFGVHRKYTGILQLCGFRLVAGDLYLPTKYDTLEERVAALEARITELSAMVLESE